MLHTRFRSQSSIFQIIKSVFRLISSRLSFSQAGFRSSALLKISLRRLEISDEDFLVFVKHIGAWACCSRRLLLRPLPLFFSYVLNS